MTNPRLASRYAKSIIDLAVERNELESVFHDMNYVQQLTSQSKELLVLLKSPIVTADKKQNVLKALTEGRVTPMTAAFMNLLVVKGRERFLPEIVKSFISQYKQIKGIHSVKLTTATPVSEAVKQRIIEQVKNTSEMQQIELETIVDPKLIGGFVLQAGDKLVDASIYYDLKEVAKQFESNDFIYKLR
jgi:F-type H+-transporting ATPase subunit delta